MIRNTTESWGALAKLFHWITAALVFGQIVLGWVAVCWRLSPLKADLYVWHKSLGMLTLTVVLLRLLWRMANPTPALPADMPRWEFRCARASFILLYAILIAMPLTGWLLNSALNIPVLLFWTIPLPTLIAPDDAVTRMMSGAHLALFLLLAALLCVHIAAALRHHYVRRNKVLARMLPALRREPVHVCALFVGVLLAGSAPWAHGALWTIDRSASSMEFLAKFEKAPAPGVFRDFDVRVQLDPQNPGHDRVDVRIAIASVDMMSPSFNRAIRAPEWFHPEQYPHAEFHATELESIEPGRYLARGTLSLKGVERPVHVSFRWKDAGDAALLEGALVLDRAAFGIGSGEWLVSSVVAREVNIKFTIKLRRAT